MLHYLQHVSRKVGKTRTMRGRMARKIDDRKLKEIFEKVEENPGKKAGFLARLLGLARSEVTRSLPALDEKGLLVYEDEEGRLFPFDRSESKNS